MRDSLTGELKTRRRPNLTPSQPPELLDTLRLYLADRYMTRGELDRMGRMQKDKMDALVPALHDVYIAGIPYGSDLHGPGGNETAPTRVLREAFRQAETRLISVIDEQFPKMRERNRRPDAPDALDTGEADVQAMHARAASMRDISLTRGVRWDRT